MDYYGDVFNTFLGLDTVIYSHKPPGFHPKYLKLCSEDEQSFYGFGTTRASNLIHVMCVLRGIFAFLFLCDLNGKCSFLSFESLIKSCQIIFLNG